MIDARTFIGEPIDFLGFKIYPPKVKEFLNSDFNRGLNLLLMDQDDLNDLWKKEKKVGSPPTPFEFLLANCHDSAPVQKIVTATLVVFFHAPINFLYEQKKLLVGDLEEILKSVTRIEELPILGEEVYFDLQNVFRTQIGYKTVVPPEPPDPNEDPRIARIKAKARERDRIKAKKGTAGGKSLTIATSLVAICCMNCGLSPLNIGEMSYAAIEPLMTIQQKREKYDIDIRSLLAGASSKDVKPKYWIDNF